jgi:hypothetical protein
LFFVAWSEDAGRELWALDLEPGLTVSRTGSGTGSVTSLPSGIDCGSDCAETYGFGTSVTLTAVAASGSTFSGWSGACSGKGECTVAVTEVKTVNARFTREDYGRTDFNGDGQGDILWHHQDTGDLYSWLLDGTLAARATYLDPPRFADTNRQRRAVADFNLDGKVDILWHHLKTGELYVWFLNGKVVTNGAYLTPRSFTDVNWRIRGVGDFDGNGSPDLLWHHQTTGALYVWMLDGTVTISGSYLTPAAFADTHWQIRGIGDFDGNSKVDVLWHNQVTGGLYVWLLDGTVTASGAYLNPPAFADTRWQIRRVADFDGDKNVDLLWHNQANGEMYVWFLDGTVVRTGVYLTPKSFADTRWQIVPKP